MADGEAERQKPNGLTRFYVSTLIMQPATACNLNCKYCYLPNRKTQKHMSLAVTEHLASDICNANQLVRLIWHGGEPLTCGIGRFRQLLRSFDVCKKLVVHGLQTNATLITDQWCDFFEQEHVSIGVSLDGPSELNANRVDWGDRSSFDQAIRGIRTLQRRGIQFSLIAVVSKSSLSCARELYNFFVDLGCPFLGINIEEQEGSNLRKSPDDDAVTRFWEDLFDAWLSNPVVQIREFSKMIEWMTSSNSDPMLRNEIGIDLLPTIAYNGDVFLLSPEFSGTKDPRYNNFVVGNVLEEPLTSLLSRAAEIPYVQQYVQGVDKCRETCEFFFCCGGGQASNKYFELADISATETSYCRNTKQRLATTILDRC